MPGAARDEDPDHRDRGDRQEHPGRTEEDGAAHDADHHHEGVQLQTRGICVHSEQRVCQGQSGCIVASRRS